MTWFRDFTPPLWGIFGGNLLMFAGLAFYSAWWAVSFRPNGGGRTMSAGLLIALASVSGLTAMAIKFLGIHSLSTRGTVSPLVYALPGAIVVYVLLLGFTTLVFQRPVTVELLLITLWAALEFSAIAALQESRRLSMGLALTLAVLVFVATVTGLACYVLHYRLPVTSRFWNGLIPLVVDAGVVAVFLGALGFS